MNLAGDTNIQSIATTIVGLEKEKDVWEVTGLYVEEEEEDANLRLSNCMTSTMDITNPGLFFVFWTVSIYGDDNECRIWKTNKN